MADSKNVPPDEGKAQISVAVEEELNETDLDKVLSEEDPEFLKTVNEIGKDTNLTLSQIELPEDELAREKEAWEKAGKISAKLVRILPFLPRISLALKRAKFKISSFALAQMIRAKNFLYFLATDGKTKLFGYIKHRIHTITEGISESQRNFRYFPRKLKIAFFSIVILSIGTGFFIYKSLTRGVIPPKDELFMPTMERVASQVFEYDPETESELFYENLRAPSNIILVPKMVVNLRKSSLSGQNPMGAFEFFVEGMVPEVVVEIKDREVEIRDLMQRVVEGFTFDQVDSADGKALLCEKLKKEVNLLLTTGKIKRVWLKTVIIKP